MLKNLTQVMPKFTPHDLALSKAQLSKVKRSEQGLTLLECLVGIVVVTAVIGAITPPIFLTVATRVQNRRADQARQLAQGEVDKVQAFVNKGNYIDTDLDNVAKSVGGVTTNLCNVDFPTDDKQLVDINNDGKKDFRVQTFRNDGVKDANGRTVAFMVGVRVYAYFEGQSLEKKRASLGFTTAQGSQRSRPLAVLYKPIFLSDTENSLIYMDDYIKKAGDQKCPT